MRIRSLGFLIAATIAVCSVAVLGQAPGEDLRTSVAPLPHEEILHSCEYRMAPPDLGAPIEAVWTIFDRGQDYLEWFEDRQIRAFARGHQLALVLAMQCELSAGVRKAGEARAAGAVTTTEVGVRVRSGATPLPPSRDSPARVRLPFRRQGHRRPSPDRAERGTSFVPGDQGKRESPQS